MVADIDLQVTKHAQERMARRGIRAASIRAAMDWGRTVNIRGAQIHALGRKEIRACREMYGLDLSRFEGVHVVCTQGGDVMTVYRNRNLRGLRRQRCRFQRRFRRDRLAIR